MCMSVSRRVVWRLVVPSATFHIRHGCRVVAVERQRKGVCALRTVCCAREKQLAKAYVPYGQP